MIRKLSYIALMVLLSSCIHVQKNTTKSKEDNPINTNAEFTRKDIITYAKKYLGTTYRYAGSDPKQGFDCSGFVYYVFKNFNINLPRSSSQYKSFGTALNPKDFKVGDILVFYGFSDKTLIGHVGIICEADGMKSKFIHSSSGKIYGVTISDLGSESYTRRFYKCIDVIQK